LSGLIVIIPFYRGLDLVKQQRKHLISLQQELQDLSAEFVLVNDYPGDEKLAEELEELCLQIERIGVKCYLHINPQNLGFVKSVNVGLTLAIQRKANALLLNSDAFPDPGCLSEMISVLQEDDLIGFVGPRSNKATLASLPWWSENTEVDVAACRSMFDDLKPMLPRVQIVPTVSGFCFLIRNAVLETVGILDEVYSPGYNEENDLVFRANRVGYRVALANWAFASHLESVSFKSSKDYLERRNSKILQERYPEYFDAIRRYYSGAPRTYEKLVTELVRASRDSWRILIDLSMLGCFHNGTFTLALQVVEQLVRSLGSEHSIAIVANKDALIFHERRFLLATVDIYESFEEIEITYTVAFRLAQPFSWEALLSLHKSAPIVGFMMLDTIALDCFYLANDQPGLESVLGFAASHADILAFISTASLNVFSTRFGNNERQIRLVSRPSTDLSEYKERFDKREVLFARENNSVFKILLVGNHYDHKMVNKTASIIAKRFGGSNVMVYALGYSGEAHVGIRALKAGELTMDEVTGLYAKADMVVFPSNSEGFGFPIVESMASDKPLVLRDRAVNREVVQNAIGLKSPVYFFQSYDELVTAIRDVMMDSLQEGWIFGECSETNGNNSWEGTAKIIIDGIKEGVAKRCEDPSFVAMRNQVCFSLIGRDAETRDELVSLRGRNSELASEIIDLRRSTSWSVTAPARRISSVLRSWMGMN
jgi:GT2 family glycosyltransferase